MISGSSSASFGKSSGPQAQTLVPSAREKTETAVISAPVPDVVGMAMTGRPLPGKGFTAKA